MNKTIRIEMGERTIEVDAQDVKLFLQDEDGNVTNLMQPREERQDPHMWDDVRALARQAAERNTRY